MTLPTWWTRRGSMPSRARFALHLHVHQLGRLTLSQDSHLPRSPQKIVRVPRHAIPSAVSRASERSPAQDRQHLTRPILRPDLRVDNCLDAGPLAVLICFFVTVPGQGHQDKLGSRPQSREDGSPGARQVPPCCTATGSLDQRTRLGSDRIGTVHGMGYRLGRLTTKPFLAILTSVANWLFRPPAWVWQGHLAHNFRHSHRTGKVTPRPPAPPYPLS